MNIAIRRIREQELSMKQALNHEALAMMIKAQAGAANDNHQNRGSVLALAMLLGLAAVGCLFAIIAVEIASDVLAWIAQ